MKADDYFRWTADLPLIDPLTTHEEIMKFPELFDQQKWTSWKGTCNDQVCTPYLSLQYQLHLTLSLPGLVQHSNPYTMLHHQLHLDQQHKDHSTHHLAWQTAHRRQGHLQAAPYHVHINHQQLVNPHQHLHEVCPLSLIVHKYLNHNHKMLHKVSLLQQTHKPFSSHLLHPSNSHCCYSPQFQAHILHQYSRVSHNLCNLG